MWSVEERAVGGAKVYVGSDLKKEILPRVELLIEEGAICVVYDGNVEALAHQVRDALKLNFRIFAKRISSARSAREEDDLSDVPEYVRHVFAVGAGSAADRARRLATRLGVDWSVLLTAPSTDKIFGDKPPKAVFIDKNVMMNCPFDCIASGYGILLARQMDAFESFFSDKVLADMATISLKCAADEEGRESVLRTQRVVELPVEEVAVELLKGGGAGASGTELIAGVLYAIAKARGRRPRLMGEYRFLAAAALLNFYSNFLGAPSIDVMPPACREVSYDKLEKLKIDRAMLPKKVDFFDVNSYFRISYILGEYRMDLLDKLGGIDIRTSQRFWRRLYPDAGYRLKSEVSVRDVLEALTLAGALSDGLLGYAFASGALSADIPCKRSV